MTLFSPTALSQSHILITGATRGIGLETAKACVKAGAAITVTGRNKELLQQLKEDCESLTKDAVVFAFAANINEADEREQLIKQAEQTIGPITGLVNSAGVIANGTLEDLTEEKLRNVMELNYFSTVLLTQSVYNQMRKQPSGAIVNVSSLAGLRGAYANTAYSASKFALTAFTQSFAYEAIQSNIRVNAVCPGYVDTDMGRQAIEAKGKREGKTYEEERLEAESKLPSGRITQPEEVANSIVFLLSDAAENIIGESMKISAGALMR